MPPKKAAQRNRTQAPSTRQQRKKQKQDEEEDALLDRLLTKQATGGMDLIIDEVCATDLRRPDEFIYGNTSDEEEARRLEKAAELQRAAEPLIAILSEEKVKKPGRFSANATAAFDQAKELLAKTLMTLAGKDVPTSSTNLVHMSTNTIKMQLKSAGIGDPPNTKNLTQKLRFAAASSIYKLLKQRPRREERNAEMVDYFARVLSMLVIPSICTIRLFLEIHQEEGENERARCLLQTAIELATEEDEKSALVQQLEDFDQSVKHVSTQMGEKELACPICLSDCVSPHRSTECVHIGCQQCLTVYLSTHKHGTCCCPICRKPFKNITVVEPVQQKLYYLDRLDRNLDDIVAWYNLSRIEECNFYTHDFQRNAFQHALTKTAGWSLPLCCACTYCAAEVLARDPDFAGDTWTNFAAGLLDLIELLPLSSRRAFSFPLGGKLGDVTPFEAVAKAISSCQPWEGLKPDTIHHLDQIVLSWSTVLRLMCYDYAEEVANGSFRMEVGSKQCTPLELVKIIIEKYVIYCSQRFLPPCIYILYLTDNMKMVMPLRAGAEKGSKLINDCTAFSLYCLVMTKWRSQLVVHDYMYLAIAWRGLEPSQRITLQQIGENVSQEALWASAIKLAADVPEALADMANAMLPEEKELVVKQLVCTA